MIGRDFPGRGKVAVLHTTPRTVLEDYARLMRLAGYDEALSKDRETLLKVNTSWQTWYPACSTEPWQLEGTIRALQGAGYKNLIAAHHRTPLVDAYVGERNNKQKDIVDAYGVRNVHLYEPHIRWTRYEPKTPLLVLDKIFPEGIFIPELFVGRNMVHLPTLKTHVFSTLAGAMQNAIGGLLDDRRRRTQEVIHEALVDLLAIQKEVHSGLFAVMDGTFAGDGAGPWAMRWHEKNILLASADQVAIDAVAAQLQGFEPMSLPFIRIAHEMGLGVGDTREIQVVGDEVACENWQFFVEESLASRCQRAFSHAPWDTTLAPWASNLYYHSYWYPFVGRPRVQAALQTPWGQHFQNYGDGQVLLPRLEPRSTAMAAGLLLGMGLLTAGLLRRGRYVHRKD